MTTFDILLGLLLFAATSVAICRKLQLPSVLGYLATGFLIGPSAFAWIKSPDDLHLLAELGIVFLLFSIGLELSFRKLWSMRHSVLVLGSLQVFLCTALPMGVAYYLGMSLNSAFVAASALALSSTAIVIKQLRDQGELFQPHGQIALGLLIFQDLAAVPLLIIVPLLAADSESTLTIVLALGLLKGLMASVLLYALARFILLPALKVIAKRPQQELFLLAVLLIVISCAWLTHLFGLSMVFGAFVAGAILSETEFKHQLEADITPFRDVLLGLFFITIGIRLDSAIFMEHWYWVLWLTLMIVLYKTLLITLINTFFAKVNFKTALTTGMILAHGGEFGFALLAVAMNAGILESDYGQVVLLGVIVSMLLSPLFLRFHTQITSIFGLKKLKQDIPPSAMLQTNHLEQHVIICGYGRVGQMISRFLDLVKTPYIAIDNDRIKINEASLAGEQVFFGDVAQASILSTLAIDKAKLLVLSFYNEAIIERVLTQVKQFNSNCKIILRVHDESTGKHWLAQGVHMVVPETQELGLSLSAQVLTSIGREANEVSAMVRKVRADHYQLLTGFYSGGSGEYLDGIGANEEILRSITVQTNTVAVGKTVAQLHQQLQGITIWSIQTAQARYILPRADYVIACNDVLVLRGLPGLIEEAEVRLVGVRQY